MIAYDNQNQLQIIFTVAGSVIPSCLYVGCTTFVMGLALAITRQFGGEEDFVMPTEILEANHEAFVIVLCLVMGFLLVVRTNMALERWMDGVSEVQVMLSKWADAFNSLNGFFAGRAGSNADLDRILLFRVRIAHWFSLMSCLAFATLRGGGRISSLDLVPIRELFVDEMKHKKAKSFTTTRRHGSFQRGGSSSSLDDAEKDPLLKSLDLYVLAAPTAEEIGLLEMASDKVNAVCLWIVQGIILEARSGSLDTPPPIITRTFQELSSGMLGFNQAHKVAMVPFPFPFAQMVSVLLFMLYVSLPFYIDMFTKNAIITPLFSFILPVCYCGLNRIAIELEEPFGTDWNDVDIEELHTNFLLLLIDVLRLPRDPPQSKGGALEGKILRGLTATVGGDVLGRALDRQGYIDGLDPKFSGDAADAECTSELNSNHSRLETAESGYSNHSRLETAESGPAEEADAPWNQAGVRFEI